MSPDPLGIDGTISSGSHTDAPLTPTQASAGQWLVGDGSAQPVAATFRQGKEQLRSVDVGSSNWEEINYLLDAPTTGLINRGWPCYEGTTGLSLRYAAWDALDKPICEELYGEGRRRGRGAVLQLPDPHRRDPFTPGERYTARSSRPRCPASPSASSGATGRRPTRTSWSSPTSLRGCIWRLEKGADGQRDPGSVRAFAQGAGSPVDLTTGRVATSTTSTTGS